jgi:MFS family permease
MVALACFAVGMLVAGRLLDRLGPRRLAVIGGVLVGAGYLLAAAALGLPDPLAALVLSFGVLGGLGIGFAYSPPIPTAARWFPDRRGLATGLVVMGFGLSPLATAPLVQYLLDSLGVAPTFAVLGLVFLPVLAGLGFLLRFPPAGYVPPRPVPEGRRAAARDATPGAMVRSPTFALAFLLYAVGSAVGFMAITQAKAIGSELAGLTGSAAVATVQWLAAWNCAGRPLFGRVADGLGPVRTLLLLFLLEMAGMALLWLVPGWVGVFAGIALVAVVFGGFLAVMPVVTSAFWGDRHLAANYGVVFLAYGAGGFVGPFLISALRDAWGSFTPAFLVGAGVAAGGLALSFLVRPPRPRVTPEPPAPVPGARPH